MMHEAWYPSFVPLLPESSPISALSITTMSQNSPQTRSSSNYDIIFDNALKAFKKKTGKDLTSDPLLQRLETCNSPDVVLGALREQIPDSDQPGTRNDRLINWLDPTVNVLLNFSDTISGAVGLAYPPGRIIITGINSLLSEKPPALVSDNLASLVKLSLLAIASTR